MSNALFIKSGRRYRAATPQDVFEAAADAYVARESGIMIAAPKDAHELCRVLVGRYEHERFGVLFLDARHRLIAAEVMFTGTIDGATVYPRVVVKRALDLNAAAVILTHQHPSGIAEPSDADRSITHKLSHALALVEIRLLDHVVLGAECAVSLAERGML
jgi:DNA repair protein RadC